MAVIIGAMFFILTKSRTAFFSCIFAMLIYWSLIQQGMRKIQWLCFASAAICLSLLLADLVYPYMHFFFLMGRETGSVEALSGRIPLWEACLNFIQLKPWLGFGFGGFWNAHRIGDFSASYTWGIGIAEAHNAYIDLILELGIVGLAAYLLVMVFSLVCAFRQAKIYQKAPYGFFTTVILFAALDGLLESTPVNPSFLFFLLFLSFVHLAWQSPEKSRLNLAEATVQ
jgi:O-antigen ligase